jgi:hypothetical protein
MLLVRFFPGSGGDYGAISDLMNRGLKAGRKAAPVVKQVEDAATPLIKLLQQVLASNKNGNSDSYYYYG